MKQSKWYEKVLLALAVILLLPFLIVSIPLALLFGDSNRKREYKRSRYCQDLGVAYEWRKPISPEYRFYNSAVLRGLPMEYIRQPSNNLEYVIHDGILFLFPDFFILKKSEDTDEWMADYDGEDKPLARVFEELTAKSKAPTGLPARLMLERDMIYAADLNSHPLPPWVYLVPSFENAFEPVDLSLLNLAPQTAAELYGMMEKTPDLCGEFELTENGNGIRWRIREDVQITLGVDPRDCYVGVSKLLFGKLESEITHWHPTEYEIYNEVCEIGQRGNVLVLCSRAGSGAVLYSGRKEDCPYKPDKKVLFGKYYYIEAK